MFRKMRFEIIKKLLTSDERTLLRWSIEPIVNNELDLEGKSEKDLERLLERKRLAYEFMMTALWV